MRSLRMPHGALLIGQPPLGLGAHFQSASERSKLPEIRIRLSVTKFPIVIGDDDAYGLYPQRAERVAQQQSKFASGAANVL
jgi:hypothetical protein